MGCWVLTGVFAGVLRGNFCGGVEESKSQGLKPNFVVVLMPGLKPRLISEAKANTEIPHAVLRNDGEKQTRARAATTAKANTVVLHCVQDDKFMSSAKESGRALLDTPPFAKKRKG
jgi:hypothetical protein